MASQADLKEDQGPSFDETEDVSSQPPSFDETTEQAPDFEDTEPTDYSSLGQQAKTIVEGEARGALGDIATAFETMPTVPESGTWQSALLKTSPTLNLIKQVIGQVNPEDIEARKEANPTKAGISEFGGQTAALAAIPEAELFGTAAKGTGWLAHAAKAGSSAINSAIQMDAMTGMDEIGKAMMGKGDPTDVVASKLAWNGFWGSLFGAGKSALGSAATSDTSKNLINKVIGKKLSSAVAGVGHASLFPESGIVPLEKSVFNPQEVANLDDSWFQRGQKYIKTTIPNLIRAKSAGTGAIKGGSIGAAAGSPLGPHGAAIGASLGATKGGQLGLALGDKIASTLVPQISQKIASPVILGMAKNGNYMGVMDALQHAAQSYKGAQAISKGVNSIFTSGAYEGIKSEPSQDARDEIKEFVENGGVKKMMEKWQQTQDGPAFEDTQPVQGFAEGGEVRAAQDMESNPIADNWPEQNVMLSSARERISSYLNSVRPLPNTAKLPYDTDSKTPQHERDYDKVVDLANQPLRILKHVKEGTLLPEHVKHFTAMYPELYGHLSKKISERMIQGQLDEEKKPPYKTRQALSLFLGSNLDSTTTPASIQAAQNVFAIQQIQRAAATPPPKKTSALSKMGQNSMTPEQSREQRLNKN